MQKQDRFTFRTDKEDREMILVVAERLGRKPSDAIRLIIRRAFVQMLWPGAEEKIFPIPKEVKQNEKTE